jgi:hypothetical protein
MPQAVELPSKHKAEFKPCTTKNKTKLSSTFSFVYLSPQNKRYVQINYTKIQGWQHGSGGRMSSWHEALSSVPLKKKKKKKKSINVP